MLYFVSTLHLYCFAVYCFVIILLRFYSPKWSLFLPNFLKTSLRKFIMCKLKLVLLSFPFRIVLMNWTAYIGKIYVQVITHTVKSKNDITHGHQNVLKALAVFFLQGTRYHLFLYSLLRKPLKAKMLGF